MCEWCGNEDFDAPSNLFGPFSEDELANAWLRPWPLGELIRAMQTGEPPRVYGYYSLVPNEPPVPEEWREQALELAKLTSHVPAYLRDRMIAHVDDAVELNKRAARRAAQGYDDVADAMDACADARQEDANAIYAELHAA